MTDLDITTNQAGGGHVEGSAARAKSREIGASSAVDRLAAGAKTTDLSLGEQLEMAEDALDRARNTLLCADYTDSFVKIQTEKADAAARIAKWTARIAELKLQIASRDEIDHLETAVAAMGDRHAG